MYNLYNDSQCLAMRVFIKVVSLGVFFILFFSEQALFQESRFFNWDSLHARPLRGKELQDKEEKY